MKETEEQISTDEVGQRLLVCPDATVRNMDSEVDGFAYQLSNLLLLVRQYRTKHEGFISSNRGTGKKKEHLSKAYISSFYCMKKRHWGPRFPEDPNRGKGCIKAGKRVIMCQHVAVQKTIKAGADNKNRVSYVLKRTRKTEILREMRRRSVRTRKK